MRKRSLKEFIQENRAEITAYIKGSCGVEVTNDEERRDWVLNDERLYLWAKCEGARV